MLTNLQKTLNKQGLVAGDVDGHQIRHRTRVLRLLDLISTVAIAAMAVASLGVANTIRLPSVAPCFGSSVSCAASVWAAAICSASFSPRRRCSASSAGLGIAAGLEISVDARQFSGAVLGYSPAMQIPWAIVAGGCLTVVAIAIAASIWPALSVARAPNRWICSRLAGPQPDRPEDAHAKCRLRRFPSHHRRPPAVFVLTALTAWRNTSPTFDEPLHFMGAWLQTHYDDFRCDPEDPPLWRDYVMLGTSRSQLKVPTSGLVWDSMLYERGAEGLYFKDVFYQHAGAITWTASSSRHG